MKPENGWELIAYKTGKNPDGTNMSTQANFVYMVLYNKYTGILRVMAAGDPPNSHNGASLKLEFGLSEYVPSLYSHISEIHSVETFLSSDKEAFSIMKYKEGNNKWFYADFPMAYDPCVCFYESVASIEISLIDKAEVDIQGDITGTLADITDPSSGQVNEDGYSFKDLNTGLQKAQKTYTSVQKFTNKQLEALKLDGKTPAQLKKEEAAKVKHLNEFQNALFSYDFLKEGLKYVPYIGGALSFMDSFVGGGAKESVGPQQVSITPTSMNANIKLDGTITAPYYFDDIIFYTPGSKDANNRTDHPDWYPYYNEPLGTVNLMEKPEVYFDESPVLTYYLDNGPGQSSTPFSYRYYKFRLNTNSVKLLLNPSADVSIQDIYGEIVFEDIPYLVEIGIPGSQYTFPFISSNMQSTAGLDVEDTLYSSRLMPLGCMDDLTIAVEFLGASRHQFNVAKTYLRLYVNLERDDADEETQNILLVAKYPVEFVDVTSNTSFNWSTPYDFGRRVDLNTAYGTVTNDVFAWDTVVITSDAVFQPGSGEIKVIAGEVIIVEPDVDIPPGVELIIENPTQCTQTVAAEGSTAISSFCQSSKYKAPTRLRLAENDNEKPLISLQLKAQPNPFRDYT